MKNKHTSIFIAFFLMVCFVRSSGQTFSSGFDAVDQHYFNQDYYSYLSNVGDNLGAQESKMLHSY
jgi:hypothetical protein